MMNLFRGQKGITLPELAITAGIFAMMGIGLMTLFIEFHRQFKISAIETQMARYANLALEEIEKDLHIAEDGYLNTGMNQMDYVRLSVPEGAGANPILIDVQYTAEQNQGILINGNPLPRNRWDSSSEGSQAFRFPNYGEFFQGDGYQVQVASFRLKEWEPAPDSPNNFAVRQALSQFIYIIELKLSLKIERTGEDVTRTYTYKRRVFMDRKFI